MREGEKKVSRTPICPPVWFKWLAITLMLLLLLIVLFLPVVIIFTEAFRFGMRFFYAAIIDPETLAAIKLTCFVAVIVVPINVIIGIIIAWAIAKFEFKGKAFIITLIDIPFSISPVMVGLAFILLFGTQSWVSYGAEWWPFKNTPFLFSVPAVVLVTLFVTFPFVARELIPLMQDQGTTYEEAAISLGASGFKTFFFVTLPNVKWGLFYGALLCNARAMGEFGAVSLVSGRLREETVTLPLQVEILYYDNYAAAFAVASLLTLLAIITLIVKAILEKIYGREQNDCGC